MATGMSKAHGRRTSKTSAANKAGTAARKLATTLKRKRNALLRHYRVHSNDQSAFLALSGLGVKSLNPPQKNESNAISKEFKPEPIRNIIVAENPRKMRVPIMLSAQVHHPESFEKFVDGHHMVKHTHLKAVNHRW